MSDSVAYFVTESQRVFAIRKADGVVLWRTLPVGPTFAVGDRLLAARDLIIYPAYNIYAYHAGNGQPAWTFRDSAVKAGGFFTLSSDSTRLFAGSISGDALALNLSDGTVAWRTRVALDTAETYVFSPAHDRGRVFVGYLRRVPPYTGGVVALDAISGAILWRDDLPPAQPGMWSGANAGPSLWNNLVIVASWDGRIHAVTADSGARVWVTGRPLGLASNLNDTRPISVGDNVVVAGSSLTVLTGFDAATGTVLWSRPTGNLGSPIEPMIAMGDSILSHFFGQLDVLSATTGTSFWQTLLAREPPVFTRPAFDATRIYVGSDSGFYALRR